MYVSLFRSEAAAPTRMNLAALILRVSLAAIFLFHGLDKIVHGSGGANWVNRMYARMPSLLDSTDQRQQVLAQQPPSTVTFAGTQLAVAWGEFLGGLALLAGLLTRLAALGLILLQVGAVILVTYPRGFSHLTGGGYEYNLVLIAVCLALLILGPGRWSVDWKLIQERARHTHHTTVAQPMPLAGPHAMSGETSEQVAPAVRS